MHLEHPPDPFTAIYQPNHEITNWCVPLRLGHDIVKLHTFLTRAMSLTAMVDGATQVTGALAAAKATVWEEGGRSIPLSNGGTVVAELPTDENAHREQTLKRVL